MICEYFYFFVIKNHCLVIRIRRTGDQELNETLYVLHLITSTQCPVSKILSSSWDIENIVPYFIKREKIQIHLSESKICSFLIGLRNPNDYVILWLLYSIYESAIYYSNWSQNSFHSCTIHSETYSKFCLSDLILSILFGDGSSLL